MVEHNKYILIRDKDWEKIFTDIEKNQDSFNRYYSIMRVKLDSDSLVDMSVGLMINDDLYAYSNFALCDYFMQGRAKRCFRHLYDIYKLSPLIKFLILVGEVRKHRAQMSICPSAMPGVHVPEIITQFCDNDFYEKDYEVHMKILQAIFQQIMFHIKILLLKCER